MGASQLGWNADVAMAARSRGGGAIAAGRTGTDAAKIDIFFARMKHLVAWHAPPLLFIRLASLSRVPVSFLRGMWGRYLGQDRPHGNKEETRTVWLFFFFFFSCHRETLWALWLCLSRRDTRVADFVPLILAWFATCHSKNNRRCA